MFCLLTFFLSQNIYAVLPEIKQIDQVLNCKDCCYPINDTFCQTFYLSCHTKSLKNSTFLQANRSLGRKKISDILSEYFKQNIKDIVLIIPSEDNTYLIKKRFNKLRKELKHNIKKLDRLDKNNNTVYQQYLKRLKSIQYPSKSIKTTLTLLYSSNFITLLEDYKSLIAINNFPIQVVFLNRNNINRCKLKNSSSIIPPYTIVFTNTLDTTYSVYNIDYTLSRGNNIKSSIFNFSTAGYQLHTSPVSVSNSQSTYSSDISSTTQKLEPLVTSAVVSTIQPTTSSDVSSTTQKLELLVTSAIGSSIQPTTSSDISSTTQELEPLVTSAVVSSIQPITSSDVYSTTQKLEPLVTSAVVSSIQPTTSSDISSTTQKLELLVTSPIVSSSQPIVSFFKLSPTNQQLQSFTASLAASGVKPITKIITTHTNKIVDSKTVYIRSNNMSSTSVLNGYISDSIDGADGTDGTDGTDGADGINWNNNITIYVLVSASGFIIIVIVVIVFYHYYNKQKTKTIAKKKPKTTLGLSRSDNTNLDFSEESIEELNEPYQLKTFRTF